MTTQELAEKILIQAAGLLYTEEKWSRTECVDAFGILCLASSDQCAKWTLLGAIGAARIYYDLQAGFPYDLCAAAHDIVYKSILRAIGELHPTFRPTRPGGIVTEFNQSPSRTYADIVEVMRHAYAAMTRQTMQFDHSTGPV